MMMMNPESIAAGVAINLASEQAKKFVNHVVQGEEEIVHSPEQLLEQIRDFSRLTAEALNPSLTHNLSVPLVLQPYPSGYTIPTHDRRHVCMFVSSGASGSAGAYTPTLTTVKLYFEIPGVGTHIKSVTIGWNQLDLPVGTIVYTADGNNYAVLFSFRDDPIGVAL